VTYGGSRLISLIDPQACLMRILQSGLSALPGMIKRWREQSTWPLHRGHRPAGVAPLEVVPHRFDDDHGARVAPRLAYS
jgi:hypothetical protein